jgi:multiple antibiotic resistance protein
VAAAVVVPGIIWWLCYCAADRRVRFTGSEGARVAATLAAFLLLCLGIRIMVKGAVEIVAVARA